MSIEQFTGTFEPRSLSENNLSHAFEPYKVYYFSEAQNPEEALRVQQLQGESYVRFGIAHESVVENGGALPVWLDQARGDGTTYYVAMSNDLPGFDGWGSGRVIDGEFESLPIYEGCNEVMYPECKEALVDEARSGRLIREVGAMALSRSANSLASFSIVRNLIQHSVLNDTQEFLVGRLTPHSLVGFKAMFGSSVRQIGESATLDAGGGLEVELTPVCANAGEVIDGLFDDIHNPDIEARRREKLANSLRFLADGLPLSALSDPVKEYITNPDPEILK